MKFVMVAHPDIEGEAPVPESSLGIHAAAGWVPVAEKLAELPKERLVALAEEKGVPVSKKASKDDVLSAVTAADTPPTSV